MILNVVEPMPKGVELMQLPNAAAAVVDIAKLRDYCLNPAHPVGKHKAAVFFAALGITQSDALILKEWIYRAAQVEDAILGQADQFGQRYLLEFSVTHNGRNAIIRSAWMVRSGEDFPRLVTCHVV